MTDEEKKAAEEKAAAEAEAAFNAKLNAAVTAHAKRLKADFEKQLADAIAKLVPPEPKPADRPAEGNAPKADPEVVKLRETVEKLTKAHAEADARAKATEEKARKDAARGALREALEAKGIKGARARAVIADLEQSGAVRFDEETGQPLLVVKRARVKGAKAEELSFDDLAAGIDDWAKTPDAAEFLPPPSTVGAQPARRPGLPPTAPPRAQGNPDRSRTDEEVAADLARQGIDLDRAFNS